MWTIFWRDMQLGLSTKSSLFVGMIFFAAIIAITPFAIGREPEILQKIGQGMIWISALLSSLIGIEKLFQSDDEDGSLDQFILLKAKHSFSLIVLAKCLSHWCSTILPLIVISPFLGLILGLNMAQIFSLVISLLCGTPALTFIGAIGASLVTRLNRGGILLSIIVLPLTVPVMIFGVASAGETSILSHITDHTPAYTQAYTPLTFLLALSLFFSIIAPFSAAMALKNLSD